MLVGRCPRRLNQAQREKGSKAGRPGLLIPRMLIIAILYLARSLNFAVEFTVGISMEDTLNQHSRNSPGAAPVKSVNSNIFN